MNTPNIQSLPKSTPETPPTSYAAAVISGPNKPSSLQNSPNIQTISASPSLGPIGSPKNSSAANGNISFGMMLPPVSSNSTFGGGSHNGSYYPPPQSSQSLFQNQHIDSHGKKSTTHLLQHQEQFPPPTSSPVRSVTANYPLPDHPHTQSYLQYPAPNSFHTSRSRAYTESFLFSMASQKESPLPFPLHHLTFSPSPDLPYPPLLPSNLESNLDESLQQENPPDDILSQSSWSPTNKKSSTGNRESQLENLFVSSRQDMERSVSLGGLGWMPSSLASESQPPASRRGVSDLGIGVGFGSSGLGHDESFGFGHNSSHITSAHPPPFVPSMSAWESFVDHSVNNSNQASPQHPQHQHSPQHHLSSPLRPHSYSLNHLYDGLSPNSRLHPPSPFGGSSMNHSSIHSAGSNSVFSHQEGDEDDHNYQELRLHAPEYNPNNSSHGTNSSASNWR